MPELLPAPTTLPMHIAPQSDEALVSWLVQLSYRLGQSPLMFSRHGFKVDAAREPGWWRRPTPERLNDIARRTGVDPGQLAPMTLLGWTLARDDENAQRLARKRGRRHMPGYRRKHRFAVCGQCLAEDERPYLRLLWIQGWTGVCPRHRTVLDWECPTCRHPFRLHGLETRAPIDPLACSGCGGSFAGTGGLAAHGDAIDLQARMIAGKRTGTVNLPNIEAMNWETMMAVADVLLDMIWSSKADPCEVLFNRVGRELGLDIESRHLLSRGLNYSSLVMLAWLLGDLSRRLPSALSILQSPRVEKLLERHEDIDADMAERLRGILAAGIARLGAGRHAWRLWIDNLPESAAELRERAASDCYKHRRQRLTVFAELKDGASVVETAAFARVQPKSIYRWLNWGIEHGLEGALERRAGKRALTSAQAEALGQWIRTGGPNQKVDALIARAMDVFGIDLDRTAAFNLLRVHRETKAGRRRKRLWQPVKPRARRAAPTHDPAPRS